MARIQHKGPTKHKLFHRTERKRTEASAPRAAVNILDAITANFVNSGIGL